MQGSLDGGLNRGPTHSEDPEDAVHVVIEHQAGNSPDISFVEGQ